MLETSFIVAMVMGLSEAFKKTGLLNIKYIPILNILLGIILSTIWDLSDIRISVFNGFICGLSASGLYSGTKNVAEGVKK